MAGSAGRPGPDLLARLPGISRSGARRYLSGSRSTPDPVAGRLHFLAFVVGDLAGAHDGIGVRRWLTVPASLSTAARRPGCWAGTGGPTTTGRGGCGNSPAPSRRRRRRDRVSARRFPLSLSAGGSAAAGGTTARPRRVDPLFPRHPDGAWAEFLRHGEVGNPEDPPAIRRSLRAVETGGTPSQQPDPPPDILTGGPGSWRACRQRARKHRNRGKASRRPRLRCAPGGAHGWRVESGRRPGPDRDGKVFALFGFRPEPVGWAATVDGRPSEELLPDVRHLGR